MPEIGAEGLTVSFRGIFSTPYASMTSLEKDAIPFIMNFVRLFKGLRSTSLECEFS